MKKLFARFWRENDGVLSFEWVALNSVVVLGVVGGLASVRDAVNDEMADMTEAITSLDQSYTIQAPCPVRVGRSNNVGNGRIQTQVTEGAGYSSKAWGEFLQRNPQYMGAQRGSIQGGSGAAGSVFMDSKPKVNRDAIDNMEAEPGFDPSMIDNQQ